MQGEIPGSPIFIMKMASNSRHLEVQLLADKHGQAIALSGRDCSVQRRHQKIIEEGPPTAATPQVFRRMEQAAISLAKTVGYVNAGTVEYLFLEETSEFAFLELNPRLQVEHPVTENILGINLPACQLQVAMGIPLHRIGEIRRIYGRHERGKDTIDFDYAEKVPINKHCIAVRVTAENPDAGFQPTSGKIEELKFRSSVDVWGYFSIDGSGSVHEFADSQFGHIFAQGKDRESARRAMVTALKEIDIRGDIRTTIEYITELLQSDDFVDNRFDTTWLDGRLARYEEVAAAAKVKLDPRLVALCGSTLRAFEYFNTKNLEFVEMLKVGQIPSKDILSQNISIDLIHKNVKYATKCVLAGKGIVQIGCNNCTEEVAIRELSDGGYLMKVNGESHVAYSTGDSSDGSLRMTLDGQTCIFTPEYDPTRLCSSVAGKIARLLVPNGAHLNAGDAFLEIEVMKMYMPLKCSEAGVINFMMSEGATLTPGDLIATMVLDNPDKVVKSELFTGNLVMGGALDMSMAGNLPPQTVLRESLSKLVGVLEGYFVSADRIEKYLSKYMSAVVDKLLPVYEIEECMAVLRGRIDTSITDAINSLNEKYKAAIENGSSEEYPASEILKILHEHIQSCSIEAKVPFINLTSPLWSATEHFLYPPEIRLVSGLINFIERFLSTEKLFDGMSFTDVVSKLRKDNQSDLSKVFDLCLSHVNINGKNSLLILIIEEIKRIQPPSVSNRPKLASNIPLRGELNIRQLKRLLTEISTLKQTIYSHVALSANLVLMEQYTMTIEQRRARLNDVVNGALVTGDSVGTGDRAAHLKKFAESNIAIRDLLFESLSNDRDYKLAFIELYLRKIYQKTHNLTNLTSGNSLLEDGSDNTAWLKFEFSTRGVDAVTGEESNITLSYSDLANLARTNSLGTSACSDSENEDEPMLPVDNMGNRIGVFGTFESGNQLTELFPHIISKIPSSSKITPLKTAGAVNVAYLTVATPLGKDNNETSAYLTSFLRSNTELIKKHGVKRITFLVSQEGKSEIPCIFNFKESLNFNEDKLYRQIEYTHAFHLDLRRLSNFSISLVEGSQTLSGNVHLYRAVPVEGSGPPRYLARLLSFPTDQNSNDSEFVFVEALDNLGLVLRKSKSQAKSGNSASSSNHIFLNVVAPDLVVQPDSYVNFLKSICTKYSQKLVTLGVAQVEMKITCRLADRKEPMHIRMVASNPTGFVLNIDRYFEAFSNGVPIFKSTVNQIGEWDGLATSTPYSVTQKFEFKRAQALNSSDTLYVYDWPILFHQAVKNAWTNFVRERPKSKVIPPESVFTCTELVMCSAKTSQPLGRGWAANDAENDIILPVQREPGLNDVGMVAWLMVYKSPECPDGREIVVICNDITHQAGSFGTKEDLLFFKASEYARVKGIPRLYLAANSGARIGMAKSLQDKFHVCWIDEKDPSRGYRYIYLTMDEYDVLMSETKGDASKLPLICKQVDGPNNTPCMMITDIIGKEPDLGVENLMGSGLIAGETSRAYQEVFTLTLVVGRTVGIGAYLVRLGQRTIQRTTMSPIILTGYQALNKLMGREIYTTNDQLGGPMIMFPNGVSHQLAENHMESITKALSWLSFVPARRGASLPIIDIGGDTLDRTIGFAPPKGLPYDPRNLLSGVVVDDKWESGFLDKGSFVEALGGWAKTVVIGRGRLGGVPIGVIVTENRTAEATKPADPADMSSQEKMVQQAGGVWFPDSAYKTAQALKDFNREKLPCIVFANWRGFSGGQRDMFDEVLKFGSMIVDALVAYEQPLLVYIPPQAELRGGAWVVVDSTINADVMEFYAAEDARGGVLEAAGAASIKFREKDVKLAAHRLDPVLKQLDAEVSSLQKDDERLIDVQSRIAQREKSLLGIYSQIAVHFADLHDTPGRMKAKGVIKRQVDWKDSRAFFYWRLRRRLTEFDFYDTTKELKSSSYSRRESSELLKSWYLSGGGQASAWDDDKAILNWYETHQIQLHNYLTTLRNGALVSKLSEDLNKIVVASNSSTAADENAKEKYITDIVTAALSSFDNAEKSRFLNAIKKL